MGINLVVIPFHDWKKCEREGFRTRDAHFMQEFEKHPSVNKMLIINRPISISEALIFRRNIEVKNGELLYKKNGVFLTKVSDKVFVLDIFIPEIIKPLVMRRNWISYVFGKKKVYDSIIKAANLLEIKDNYDLFISEPLFVPLVKKLSPHVFVFDAQDNLLKHAMYKNVKYLQENYQYCLENADLIYANSKDTTKWFNNTRKDATHIPNGVDISIFDGSKSFNKPDDMKNISSPIVGYAGKIQDIFNTELMEETIQKLPHINFVFIGQILNPEFAKNLWRYPNSHYLGDKHYHLVPQYLASFDVCIVPIKISRQHGGDPIKFYEYLAMRKPIVTTEAGNTTSFIDYPQVKIAIDEKDFISGIHNFTNLISEGKTIEKKPLPENCSWKYKVNTILSDIKEKAGN